MVFLLIIKPFIRTGSHGWIFFKFVQKIQYYLPWKRTWSFISTWLTILHQRTIHAKLGWEWLSGSGEDWFFKSSVYFHYFDPSYSPCKRAIKSCGNWPSGSVKVINAYDIFTTYIIITPWNRVGLLFEGRMFCAKFDWNSQIGCTKEDF